MDDHFKFCLFEFDTYYSETYNETAVCSVLGSVLVTVGSGSSHFFSLSVSVFVLTSVWCVAGVALKTFVQTTADRSEALQLSDIVQTQ